MIKTPKLRRKLNPETIIKDFRKNLNNFIGKSVGVYGPNIHFHGKLIESDDSESDRNEGLIEEPNEWGVQIDNGNTHGYLFFSSKNVRKIILDQPGQQKIQIFINLSIK